ncbi:MAG: hypothetical protein V2I26_08970 [Halieaceae bacterium]|jgi:hypothetical protein|nr:hypothetical protein [Halieaceae bacterium]
MSTQAPSPAVLEAHIKLLEGRYDPEVAGENVRPQPSDGEFLDPDDVVPDHLQRLQQVAERVFRDPCHFAMESWEDRSGPNDCNTTRCMAGWAVTLAGAQGKRLYELFNENWGVAGAVLLGVEAAEHFGDDNREAYWYLRQFLPPDSPFAQEPEPLPSICDL